MYVGVVCWYVNDSQSDATLRLLSDPAKRRIVRHLIDETDDRVTVDELVDRLLESAGEGEAARAESRSQLAIELHHAHLPKLAAHDVVAFDPDAGAVTCRDTDAVASVLESLPRESPRLDA